MPPTNWEKLLLAWMHDPADKALDIRGHEARTERYLSAALGRRIERSEYAGLHDQLASSYERLPMPTAGAGAERSVGPTGDGTVLAVHPLSATAYELRVDAKQDEIERAIREIASGVETDRQKFLALWRLLPERLADLRHDFPRLPADTRCPDHTIFHHMDIAAGLARTLEGGAGQTTFLSFKLSPVQPFIEAARSTRDLLSGSYILAWLTFHAMEPLIKELGPTALVYPSLRGLPLMDRWLREEAGLEHKIEPPQEILRPCLPNRFLAVVPTGPNGSEAGELARAVEQGCRKAWSRLAGEVREYIRRHVEGGADGWDRLWDAQVESFFSVRTVTTPLRQCGPDLFEGNPDYAEALAGAKAVQRMADAIPGGERYGFAQDSAGRWQFAVATVGAVMEAASQVRHIPRYKAEPPVPQKCTLMGTYEQVGPALRGDLEEFWRKAGNISGSQLKESERLCAVSMVKRLAFAGSLKKKLGVDLDEVRFPDTDKIATLGWDGTGGEPKYYAILAMDGDELGKWLSGAKSPKVEQVLHPKLRDYYGKLTAARDGLTARRPVGPALHAAISEAVANFALRVVPAIVEKHHGVLVYSGGDDVLALLPARFALSCARELYLSYRGESGGGAPPGYYRAGRRDWLTMGPAATVSAGIAVVHFKEDMRMALEGARQSERRAKDAGRNRLALTVWRRSGERVTSVCEWDIVPNLERLVERNAEGASDRWTYQLRREGPTLEGLPREAQWAEVVRVLKRGEKKKRIEPEEVQELWNRAGGFERFVQLCQSASFLARGRDE
jgi:CRISPR-associated protein Cmr2